MSDVNETQEPAIAPKKKKIRSMLSEITPLSLEELELAGEIITNVGKASQCAIELFETVDQIPDKSRIFNKRVLAKTLVDLSEKYHAMAENLMLSSSKES